MSDVTDAVDNPQTRSVGPLEAFDLWWGYHDRRGELHGVDRSDAQMVWVAAQRELLAEVARLKIALERTTLTARYLDEAAAKLRLTLLEAEAQA